MMTKAKLAKKRRKAHSRTRKKGRIKAGATNKNRHEHTLRTRTLSPPRSPMRVKCEKKTFSLAQTPEEEGLNAFTSNRSDKKKEKSNAVSQTTSISGSKKSGEKEKEKPKPKSKSKSKKIIMKDRKKHAKHSRKILTGRMPGDYPEAALDRLSQMTKSPTATFG